MLVAVSVLPGCPMFQSVCAKALPVLVSGQAYSQDAQQAIIALERVVANSHLPPADIANVRDALDKANVALRAAEQTMATAAQVCQQQDLGSIFGTFIQAWDIVRQVIVAVGLFKPHTASAVPQLSVAAPGAGQLLGDPAIYVKMRHVQ